LDWNFHSPPFYLECRYGGMDLGRWAEQTPGLAGLDRERRIALFLLIADAVAAAHGVGVLHKDLKPANVLISGTPQALQVALTDFGSGRLLKSDVLERMGITAMGMTVTPGAGATPESGTPLYWAPEVIAGQVATVQSDVYALGVMLFQLLVGDLRRPFTPGWEAEIEDPLLVEDIARATAREIEARFSAAAQLAASLRNRESRTLERVRAAELVAAAAGAQRALDRARARRPWVLVTGLSLICGLGITLFHLQSASQSRDLARAQAQRAESINAFWTGELTSKANDFVPSGDHTMTLMQAFLDMRQRIDASFADDANTGANIHMKFGTLLQNVSRFREATEEYRAAAAIWRREQGPGGPDTLLSELALGRQLSISGNFDEARDVIDGAIAAAGDLDVQSLPVRYMVHRTTATLHRLRGDFEVSVAAFDQAIAAAELIEDLSALHGTLLEAAEVAARIGRDQSALGLSGRVLEAAEQGEKVAAGTLLNAKIIHGLALASKGDSAASLTELLNVEQLIIEQGHGDTYILATVRSNMSEIFAALGRWHEAAAYARGGAEAVERLAPEGSYLRGLSQATLAKAELNLGDTATALDRLIRARTILLQAYPEESAEIVTVDFFLATAEAKLARYKKAQNRLRRVTPEALANSDSYRNADWAMQIDALRDFLTIKLNAAIPLSRSADEWQEALLECDCAPPLATLYSADI